MGSEGYGVGEGSEGYGVGGWVGGESVRLPCDLPTALIAALILPLFLIAAFNAPVTLPKT